MNNDLISREALKKAIMNDLGLGDEENGSDAEYMSGLQDCYNLIDNAPTVEPPKQLVLRARNDAELEQLKTAWGNGEICFTPIVAYTARPQGDLIKAFELLKAHCKNRECNKDCVFYRELRVGDNEEQFCGLCEIVTSDDKEKNND